MSVDFSEDNIESTYLFDLQPLGNLIEAKIGDLLEPAPRGIYLNGRIDPIASENNPAFMLQDNILVPVLDLKHVTTALYDKNKRCIASGNFIRQNGEMISEKPISPFRGTLIAEFFVKKYLDNFISWRRHRSSDYSRVLTHFKKDVLEKNDWFDLLERLQDGICEPLYDWLDGKTWNIYLANRKNTKLCVNRYGDYRIIDWMNRFENGEIQL